MLMQLAESCLICVSFIVLQIKDMSFFPIQVHEVSIKQDVLKDIQLPGFNNNKYTKKSCYNTFIFQYNELTFLLQSKNLTRT